MANLLVRGVDDDVVRALKERAGEHGQSAEAEHRAILAEALTRPSRRTFGEVLASRASCVKVLPSRVRQPTAAKSLSLSIKSVT